MDELVNCVKCQSIPYDVLMMNCNHNLCVKCAVNRMQSQQVVKSVTGRLYIQCEKCKARTNLDEESVAELERAKKGNNSAAIQYIDKQGSKRVQTPINTGRQIKKTNKSQQVQFKQESAKVQTAKLQHTPVTHQSPVKTTQQHKKQESGTPKQEKKPGKKQDKKQIKKQRDYGQCQQHKQQPVMYYCFTCNIHCFCAECVLLGKHNKHDVKIIKKAYSMIEKQFQDAVQSTKKFINELIDRNRSVITDINASKNKADGIKKTIEKGFDEVRHLIRQKQLQFMKMVDKQFTKMMQTSHGVIKTTIDTKLKQQQSFLLKLQHTSQNGEGAVLNLFADEGDKIRNMLKNQTISLPTAESKLDEALTTYITEVKGQLQKIQVKQIN